VTAPAVVVLRAVGMVLIAEHANRVRGGLGVRRSMPSLANMEET
jgi:hypothetical protein